MSTQPLVSRRTVAVTVTNERYQWITDWMPAFGLERIAFATRSEAGVHHPRDLVREAHIGRRLTWRPIRKVHPAWGAAHQDGDEQRAP